MTTANWVLVFLVAFVSIDATIFVFCSVWTGYQSKFSLRGILKVLFVEKFKWNSLKMLASVCILLGGPAFFFLMAFQVAAGRHSSNSSPYCIQTISEQVSRIEDSLPFPIFAISCVLFLVGYNFALLADKEDFKHSCHLCGKKKLFDSVYCGSCEEKLGVKSQPLRSNLSNDYWDLAGRYGVICFGLSWLVRKGWNAMRWALDVGNNEREKL